MLRGNLVLRSHSVLQCNSEIFLFLDRGISGTRLAVGRNRGVAGNFPANLVPFGGGAPHLQSQGKAPWGRDCFPAVHFNQHYPFSQIAFHGDDQLISVFQHNNEFFEAAVTRLRLSLV